MTVKYIPSEVDRLCAKGLPVKPKGGDALLPSPEDPNQKLVKKSLPNEDPLKTCILERLNEGGRNEEEARKWCQDYLAMKAQPDISDSAACDSANLKEAERVFMDAKESLKPYYFDKCIAQRQRLFGENEFEAKRRCVIDYEISERVHGPPYGTDQTSLRQIIEFPESFHKLGVLVLQLDDRTEELMETCNFLKAKEGCAPPKYTEIEADRKARTELGLPQVDHPQKPEPATMPEVFGKSKEQRIKESYAADKRPGERMISPFSGVPNLYGKSREQIIKEIIEQDAEDKNR